MWQLYFFIRILYVVAQEASYLCVNVQKFQMVLHGLFAFDHRVSGAESLPFPDSSLQLVTAGQACHWFDMPKFLKEADRVLVPGESEQTLLVK